MKRNTRPSQGRDLDIGSRPVETTQHAEVNKTTAVKIPRAQAVWVALPFSMAVIVTIISPIALGPRIFWATCGVTALAAFLWSVQYEMLWQDRLSLPLLVGLVMLCLWRFADWQGWRVPDKWQPIPAIIAIGSLVFWWTFTAGSWLTFWQRLGMPMYHQQYSVWKALGNLLEHWGKRERVEAQAQSEQVLVTFEFKQPGGNVRHNVRPPCDYETLIAVAKVLLTKTYSVANLAGPGKPFPGGEGGRKQVEELKQWLLHWKLLKWKVDDGNGDGVATSGVELTEDNGTRWIREIIPGFVEEVER